MKKQEKVTKRKLSIKYGLIAGFIMAVILALFEYFWNDSAPYLRFVYYIPLFICIAIAIRAFKNRITGNKIFIKGFDIGFRSSLIAGGILFIINICLFLLSSDLAFTKFTIHPGTIGQAFIISAILLFETIAFGMIFSFINLTYLKEPVKI